MFKTPFQETELKKINVTLKGDLNQLVKLFLWLWKKRSAGEEWPLKKNE
jgi:hypothetical protein